MESRSATPDEIKLGIYRHYRGPLYQVLGIAHDANADTLCSGNVGTSWDHGLFEPLAERTVVVYMPLQLDGAHLGPRMAVRTLEDFLGKAVVSKQQAQDWLRMQGVGVAGRHGDTETWEVRRFTYLGQELTQEMLQ